MARRRRLNLKTNNGFYKQRSPPIAESRHTFRSLAISTVAFFLITLLIGGLSSLAGNDRPGNAAPTKSLKEMATPTATVYHEPSTIPLDVLENLDLIIILGGGVPESIDRPPPYVQTRCDDAAAVITRRQEKALLTNGASDESKDTDARAQQAQHVRTASRSTPEGSWRLPILCLSAGTAHLPQLLSKGDGLPIWESTASAAYLLKQYSTEDRNLIHPEDLYVETTSYDTIGNAFYARTTHTDMNTEWRRLLVITNKFHMDRSKAIFDWIFSLDSNPNTSNTADEAASSRKRKREDQQQPYELYYLASADDGLSQVAVEERAAREKKSLESVNKMALQYRSLRDVWRFLNQDHALYTASKLVERGRSDKDTAVSDEMKKSYGGSR